MADVYLVMTDGVSNGTATGTEGKYTDAEYATIGADGFANALTNDWASKSLPAKERYYYPTVSAALTAGATGGDRIICADTHAYSVASTISYSATGSPTADVAVISVDVTSIDTYKAGASETSTSTGTSEITSDGFVWYGFTFKTAGTFQFGNDGKLLAHDGAIHLTGTFDRIYMAGDGSVCDLRDMDIHFGGTSNYVVEIRGGGIFRWWGGTLVSDAGGDGFVDYFGKNENNLGGGLVDVRGVDLSVIDGNGVSYLFQNHGGAWGDDGMCWYMDMCKIKSGMDIFEEDFVLPSSRAITTRTTSSTTEGEYQYQVKGRNGEVNEDTSFYRDGSTAFEETNQKISLLITTTAACSKLAPFWFDFPSRYVELATTASDVVDIYILSSAALDDDDIWAELMYPDGTNKNVGNMVTSAANVATGSWIKDPLAGGGALLTNTETWTGRTSENRYHLRLDTSGDAGADCVPDIRLFVGKATATIYACPTLGLS